MKTSRISKRLMFLISTLTVGAIALYSQFGQHLASASVLSPQVTPTIPPPQSALPFYLSFEPVIADIGDSVRAQITLANPTAITATQVVITNNLSSLASYVVGGITPTGSISGAVLVWHLPDLLPGQTFTLRYQFLIHARSNENPYNLYNSAEFQALPFSPEADPSSFMLGHNYFAGAGLWFSSYLDPHWIISHTAQGQNAPFACPGDVVTYTIGLAFLNAYNYFPEAMSAIITDVLPAGVVLIPESVQPKLAGGQLATAMPTATSAPPVTSTVEAPTPQPTATTDPLISDGDLAWQVSPLMESSQPNSTLTFAVRVPITSTLAQLTNTVYISGNGYDFIGPSIAPLSHVLTQTPILVQLANTNGGCPQRLFVPQFYPK